MLKRLLPLILFTLCAAAIHAQTVAYVTSANDNTVSVIDTSTNTVAATIPVGQSPFGVAFLPDSTRAFVTNFFGGSISVIDTDSNTVIATIALPIGSFPAFLAVTPDGKSLYVPEVAGNVLVVSTATNTVTATIPVSNAFAAAITPDGRCAYVLSENTVSVIDTASNTVVGGPISVPAFPPELPYRGIAITPAGKTAYVAGGLDGMVTAISTATNTVSASVVLPAFPLGLAITPDDSRDDSKVYFADFQHNVVSIIDADSNTLEPSSISVGPRPFAMAFTPDGAFAYVTNSGFFFRGGNTVSVISTATNTVVATVAVGDFSLGIATATLHHK